MVDSSHPLEVQTQTLCVVVMETRKAWQLIGVCEHTHTHAQSQLESRRNTGDDITTHPLK